MLLRRIIRHFQEQSWTAITIDFLIVVLGVFVGIQVNNWNLDRLDAQRAPGTGAGRTRKVTYLEYPEAAPAFAATAGAT